MDDRKFRITLPERIKYRLLVWRHESNRMIGYRIFIDPNRFDVVDIRINSIIRFEMTRPSYETKVAQSCKQSCWSHCSYNRHKMFLQLCIFKQQSRYDAIENVGFVILLNSWPLRGDFEKEVTLSNRQNRISI